MLASYDPQYNADALPANLAEAKSDLNKMGAMVNSIDRADAAIRQRAADEGLLEQNMTVEQTAAYLDAQYAAMSARIQALEVEIASLQDSLNNTEDETERADLQAQIDAKRAEQAQAQAVIDATPPAAPASRELSGNLSRSPRRRSPCRNATTLLDCAAGGRDCAERRYAAAAADAERHRRALRDQLTKAQEMLTQLNEQRDKLQKMLASLGDEAIDPAMADMAVQLLLSGTEAQLQLGEFRVSSGKTQLEAGKTQLEAAQEEYESAREEALKSANLNQLLNMATLQQLIYAQNFSMPAGYIEGGDGDDNRYIVKVGDAFADADELKSMVLCNIDGIGDVRLSDVAEVEMTDNADDAYAKVDKNRARAAVAVQELDVVHLDGLQRQQRGDGNDDGRKRGPAPDAHHGPGRLYQAHRQ
mgnify:CR=1 FL=1